MVAKVTVRITGLKELDAALGELTKATARNTARRALVKAAAPIEETARQLAPAQPRGGHLRRGIHTSTKPPKGGDTGKQAFAEVLRGGGTRGEAVAALKSARAEAPFTQVWVGAGLHPQAMWQEFGTVRHGPQAYMRPAFDSKKREAVDIVAQELRVEIDKAAARAARKAAKAK